MKEIIKKLLIYLGLINDDNEGNANKKDLNSDLKKQYIERKEKQEKEYDNKLNSIRKDNKKVIIDTNYERPKKVKGISSDYNKKNNVKKIDNTSKTKPKNKDENNKQDNINKVLKQKETNLDNINIINKDLKLGNKSNEGTNEDIINKNKSIDSNINNIKDNNRKTILKDNISNKQDKKSIAIEIDTKDEIDKKVKSISNKNDLTIDKNKDVNTKNENVDIESEGIKSPNKEKDNLNDKNNKKDSSYQNKKDISILNELKKTLEKDIDTCKEMNYEMYLIENSIKDILLEDDKERQKEKIKVLEKKLNEIREKYNKLLKSHKEKDFEYLEILHVFNTDEEIRNALNSDNENVKKYKDEIITIIDNVTKKHKELEDRIKEKEKEILEKEQYLNKINDVLIEVAKFKDEAAKTLKIEQDRIKEIKNKIGVVSFNKTIHTRLTFDISKLFAPALMLGLTETNYPNMYKTSAGRIIQAGTFSFGLYRLSKAFSFKDEERYNVKFNDYKDLLSNMDFSIDSLLDDFKYHKKSISNIKKDFTKNYSKEIRNSNEFQEVLKQINSIEKQIEAKEKELMKEKELNNERIRENEKARVRYREKLKNI